MPPKRRRRFQGLYYHSSPPKVLSMNGKLVNSDGRRRHDPDDLSIKLSTIRIWMHEKDIGKLTRVLWAGQGNRLRQQASTNPKVKRFLTAVPHVMNSIKDVHQAVIDNSLETLQANLEPPVPPALVTCRDANGLNLIHKAAGLGHATILEYLITTWPDGVHETDITGKTPLHWAASAKNNMRCYTLLTQGGCDEEAVDYKMKTPSFYRHKPHEIERAFLMYVPEAPRVSQAVATDWEALSDDGGDCKKLDIKIPEMNGFGRHSNAESNENTSEAEMTEAISVKEDEEMSKDGDANETVEPAGESGEDHAEVDNEEAESKDVHEGTEEPSHEENEVEKEENEETTVAKEGDEDEEKETQNELQEYNNKDEEYQDEKQQTETLNETTANLTKDSEDDDELERKTKKENNERSNESNGDKEENENDEVNSATDDLKMESDQENIDKNEHETDISDEKPPEKDNDENNKETADDKNYKDTEDENKSEPDNDKSSREILGDETSEPESVEKIKDTVDENISDHDNDEESKETVEEVTNTDDEKTAIEEEKTDDKNTSDSDIQTGKENIKTSEENVGEVNKDNVLRGSDDGKNEKIENDLKAEESMESINIKETINDEDQTTDNDQEQKENEQNVNSSNENTKPQTSPATTPTFLQKESLKKENDKTEEDENNNSNKMTNEVETSNTTTKQTDDLNKPNTAEQTTDDQFNELKKSLEEFKIDEENSNENKEKYMGEKLEEMADNLKENVKEIANKVMNVLSTTSTTKDDHEKLENEANDTVVHTESPQKQTTSKKVVNDGESSDETADEDEEPQVEAEKVQNSDDNEAKNKVKNDIESQNEPVAKPESRTDIDEVDNKDDGQNNEENLDNEQRNIEGSPTSSLVIEGFVQGDSEDNTVQSQTAAFVHDDEEKHIESVIASGDMEQLAQIVLNGDGRKLLNVEATEAEIQAFLKNVPNYMSKIRRVHEAARNGSLLNLQQALDRRKFAVAKDEISPNGATPLHVAVLFGNSDIVRYLSARFPETTTIADNDGRAALHYAAVINDNGHFYNVLLQLGANPKVVDKMGHTPEDYLGKEELKDSLNYGQLLRRFGAEELEQQLLSDQGQIENPISQENPIFKTEQGKYLADNLADPLIKALTQVAHKRPNDPLEYLTNYLQSYVSSRNTNGRTITQAAIHSGSSQTNSTVLASSKHSTPPPPPLTTHMQRQTARMNGHVKYANADSIEEDTMQQLEEHDDDDGNNSDAENSKKLEERDEHGQSMLHFACARSHRKGGLIHLIEEAKADITYRDELYRTARDVALQANQLGNAKEIDRYVMSLAIVGDTKPFEHLAISGYDHIIDVFDDNETPIIEVLEARGLMELAEYLRTIRPLEELREELHQMIRDNKADRVKEIANGPDGKWLIKAKNYYGRTALHIAILKESIEIVEHFVNRCPESLKIGDNLERTALHYAMGTNIIESISRILIQNGAKRTHKDLKGRQPSYYFMNKADILRLQEEEDENR